jgi:hypothetical protein
MIAFLIVAGLGLYALIGYRVAKWQRQETWKRVRKEKHPYYSDYELQHYLDTDRDRDELRPKVLRRTIGIGFIWPYVLPARLITSAGNKFVDRGDPVWEKKQLAAQLAERNRELAERAREAAAYQRYIRQLEQEAGIAGAGDRHADGDGDDQRGDGLV